ncbi:MAG: ZIP family metal transporter [Comamonas sp.]
MMVGVWALCHQFWAYAQNHPVVLQALAGGSAAALATALGTVPVMFSQRMSERTQDTLFGFGAGVMLAACAFSLILPGLEAVRSQGMFGGSGWAAGGVIGCAILLGALALMVMDKMLPHEHFIKGREGMDVDAARKLQRTWLFVFAIALHNLPEGLAIGVGYASGSAAGNALATGIAIQDVPEGLVVAVALLAAGYSRKLSVLLGMLSGLIEPVGAVLGAAIVSTSLSILPWGLGFAAGAMLFVISHEIIPESHRKGHETYATGGLMLGFVLMMIMDTSLS